MFFRATRNSGGRHARQQQAPAAPRPVVPAPRPPVMPGGGARLAGSMPAAIIELTDTHAHLLAGVLLNAGEGFKDVAASAPEDAAEAYVRWLEGEVERLKGQPPCTEEIAGLYGHRLIVGSEPKTGKGPLGRLAREQIAAYRHMAEGDNTTPDASHPDTDDRTRM